MSVDGAVTAADPAAVRQRRLLGVGVRADLVSAQDLARDVVLARSATGVDLALVTGIDALDQDLQVALTTLRGSDPLNTRFGFLGLSALVEQSSPVLAREGLRSAVVDVVAGDARVRRIVDLTVAPAGGAGSRVVDITVAFEAVSGDQVSLALGGMASGATWGSLDAPSTVGEVTA
jgi:phage baseplate assembly protein W